MLNVTERNISEKGTVESCAKDDAQPNDLAAKLYAVYELGKPKVAMLIMFTAVVGIVLALPYSLFNLPWIKLFWATLGIGLMSRPVRLLIILLIIKLMQRCGVLLNAHYPQDV